MIRLPNNYAITADEHQYVLNKLYIAGPTAKKPRVPGEEYAVPISYYSTLSKLLQSVIKRLQRDAVASGEISSLTTVAAEFERINRETKELVFAGEGEIDGI